jgi:hypothetical protein
MQSAPGAVPSPCPNRPAIVPEEDGYSTPPCEAFPDRADKRAVSVQGNSRHGRGTVG